MFCPDTARDDVGKRRFLTNIEGLLVNGSGVFVGKRQFLTKNSMAFVNG
jgi:hypothetical protein